MASPVEIVRQAQGCESRREGAAAVALLASVTDVAGIGPRAAQAFGRLLGAGPVPSLFDLLGHAPVGLDQRAVVEDLRPVPAGTKVLARLVVEAHLPPEHPKRPYKIRCRDRGGFVHLVFFRAKGAWLRQRLPEGEARWVAGSVDRFGYEIQITHPDSVLSAPPGGTEDGSAVQPVYPLVQGIGQAFVRRGVAAAVAGLPDLAEWQDPAFVAVQAWPDPRNALRTLHEPREAADLLPQAPARRRLAYDELLAGALALQLVQGRRRRQSGRTTRGDGRLRRQVEAALPFALTGGQQAAIRQVEAEMASPLRMVRLLQGDVGSGKTLVGLQAMLIAVEAGRQAVLMAPTDLLARQHARGLSALLAPLGIEPVLLTGRQPAAQRRGALARLASGDAAIAIGTHALFQDGVAFADLALVVIDEQHRFGVHQRLDLAAKGALPDLLVMTATPIPRSLILTVYGDMAVSRLLEKPPGRLPVTTRVLPLERMDDILAAVERALAGGERLYWVCPVVAEDEGSELVAAETRATGLAQRFGAIVGLIHGRMGPVEKGEAMAAFQSGARPILVATTVIEVGVDVPEAGVIVIEQAECFGLAQLHQLRGRVGRGNRPGTCLLLYRGPLGRIAKERLKVLRGTEDGFVIAEEDLRLRGPGEVLGTRQSGMPDLRFADLGAHADLMAAARQEAKLVLARDPRLTSPRGRALRGLLRLFGKTQAMSYLASG
ncbi:ATP-dependent DNA helicase RecG [Marinivivus vitaminiproducens]|uniref:ATP-dependent DNA helicase RecG n=1 Tax=Marinivivus vitaminiproducens TaxID=3035935 RepID=UPI0027AA24EB|nr:ATP-dependent DNA helicase RecG [Geminicoccaceae bacterium SCSIO 64248]